jgi:hypothetical protein
VISANILHVANVALLLHVLLVTNSLFENHTRDSYVSLPRSASLLLNSVSFLVCPCARRVYNMAIGVQLVRPVCRSVCDEHN